jgi:hypothetical protein
LNRIIPWPPKKIGAFVKLRRTHYEFINFSR